MGVVVPPGAILCPGCGGQKRKITLARSGKLRLMTCKDCKGKGYIIPKLKEKKKKKK